ncbi:hypothetical protein A7U60_g8782 [Sanghuangporus baumii]|uniref:Uncharacterized protein n=1 Tax=Sanghuangporus baumii TaxID=108892 RepID=A0A9Q5N7Z6_SANBA|nr:hypothetical protein A7U60_g8782 [Sanghuangporus baumii]
MPNRHAAKTGCLLHPFLQNVHDERSILQDVCNNVISRSGICYHAGSIYSFLTCHHRPWGPPIQGHEHAINASDYYAKGLLIPAAEEHYKAAEAFQTCVNQSTDEHTKETLRKLCNHHFSVGKDLQRRIAKLKEEGKDPSLPQTNQSSRGPSKGGDHEAGSPSGSALQVRSRVKNLDSSATTFDESFMVLNQQTENGGEDSPFDLFWKVTGEIMYNLSQPISFQTAAMAALDAVESRTASTLSHPEENGTDSGTQNPKSVTPSSSQKKSEVKESLSADADDFDLDDDGKSPPLLSVILS